MEIEVQPVTGRWEDFASFMAPRTPGGGCVCMVYRNSSLDTPGRIAHMRALCQSAGAAASPAGSSTASFADLARSMLPGFAAVLALGTPLASWRLALA